MRILRYQDRVVEVEPGGVLSIGNFDGVHVGHQEILKAAQQLALDRHRALTLMTFEPHPAVILHPEKAPKVLTPLDWKLHLLGRFAHACVVLQDDRDLLRLDAGQFVDRFLVQTIRPSVIVEGEDFKFGADRRGSVETLRALGTKMGWDVTVVPSRQIVLPSGQTLRVSSTMIRSMLEAGDVADAALALGRPFRLLGRVIRGRGKGRQIGFPTLNLQRPDQILPAEGVYAGWVLTARTQEVLLSREERLPAVFSLGRARTFGEDNPQLIEAHVLSGPPGDTAISWMAMDFAEHLRPQHTFSSVDDLVAQIRKDCQRAKTLLDRGRGGDRSPD